MALKKNEIRAKGRLGGIFIIYCWMRKDANPIYVKQTDPPEKPHFMHNIVYVY